MRLPASMENFPNQWITLLECVKVHPQYFRAFTDAIETLFCSSGGPLPPAYGHYIALMASSRHHCQYLIDAHTQCFLNANGDPEWLKGLKHAPKKFRDLDLVNRILAHQPWLLQASHIQELTKAGSNWSLIELAHAMVLFSHCHALCSFVLGCGISSKTAAVLSSSGPPSPPLRILNGAPDRHSVPYDCGGQMNWKASEVEIVVARLKELNEMSAFPESSEALLQEQKSTTKQNSQFVDVSEHSESCPCTPYEHEVELNGTSSPNTSSASHPYSEELKFGYIDFMKRGDVVSAPTIKSYEYRWEDQGYGQLSQLAPNVSTSLDDKFNITKSLTYGFMGSHQGVDTRRYRIAIWNYIQSLFGIRHDDYDYAEVNQMLNRPTKSFIKTACCYPERCAAHLQQLAMPEFRSSEKIHVNIIIAEARLQAELLYGLRAITRFMT